MEEKDIYSGEVMEIDLGRIMRAVLDQAWMVIIVSILVAAITFGCTYFFVTPLYESAAIFYVNNNSFSVGDASFSLSSGDLTTSRNLVDSYLVILNTRQTLNEVIDYSGVDRTYSTIKDMISSSAVNETEIFRVTVTSPDPAEAEKIANAIAYILPKRISTIIDGTSAKVVDPAIIASKPSSPSYTKNTIIGFLLGFMLSAGLIVLLEIFDVIIRSEDDLKQMSKHPILTAVPDMTAPGKGGAYYYGYGSERKKDKKQLDAKKADQAPILIGDNISFSASEAYKLLRTKLQFSFADDKKCRVIALSSGLSGEGKSLTAVNLAYSLSQLSKKVILLDCDMRRPTLAEKLNINKKPGLSSYLSGQHGLENLVQYCGLKEDEKAFHVITAGENPPNPVELLSSVKMERLLLSLREVYDYVILDLPPVGEVSDAMAVTKMVDGVLLVVRQNYCDRGSFSSTVQQFEFVQAKLLGIIFNCTGEYSGKYGKKYYGKYKYYGRYKYYGKRYSRRYSNYGHYGRPPQTELPNLSEQKES